MPGSDEQEESQVSEYKKLGYLVFIETDSHPKRSFEKIGFGIPGMYLGSSLLMKASNPLFVDPQDIKNKIRLTISEVEVEISKGLTIKTFGYNRTTPGPVLRMKQGEKAFCLSSITQKHSDNRDLISMKP